MKRKLLLLFVCLFGALGGVKAYTSVAPEDVRAYYLYNVGKGTYWYGADHNIGSGNTRYTGHTSSLYDATPTRVRISSGNYTFTYYVNGVEYQIRHTDNNGEAVLTGGNANFQLYDKTDYKYTIEFKSDKQRRMRAEDAGTCDYPKDLDNNTVHWRFYAYEEILPDLVAHNAPTCISTAASIVSGWERVTTKEQLAQNPERYFYAIFSAVNPGVMMTTEYKNDAYRMCYKAAGNPLSSSSYDLFEMENYDGEFAIKSNITGKYYGNTSEAPWNFIADQEALNEDCKVTVTCSNGVYNLQDKYAKGQDEFVGNYLGAWDNMEFVGERLAGNKGSKRAGYFLIYRKLKKDLDMTSRITNPSFEAEDISAWSCTTGSDTGRKENSGNYFMSNVAGTYLFNTWNNGNASEVSQTLSNMPSGFYTLSAVMASDNGSTLQLKVGNDVIATSPATGAGNGIKTSGSFSFSGGNMVIKADANNHWYKADNFRLTYIGSMDDLTPVSGKMNADVNTAQQNAISTYNSNKTVANYIAAQDAIANAEASVAAYANALTYLEKVEEVLATTNFYTTAAYNSVYGTYKTAYDNSTLDDATAAGLSYKVAGSGGSARYDANTANDLLIPGWTIGGNDATALNSGFYINTWSIEGDTDGSGMTTPFYEYWTGDANQLEAKSIVGTLSGLTANSLYYVSALVRVRLQNSQTKADNGITFKVGDGAAVSAVDGTQSTAPSYTSMYYKTVSAFGMTDAGGNLAVTFTVNENSHISWLSFKNVVYTEIGKGGASNLDFATGAVTDGICIRTYAKDITGSDVSGLQNVPGWIILNNGDQRAAGVMNVNSGTGLGNGANVVPSAGYDALSNGKVLGIEAVWTATTQYVQAVTLSAGNYKIVMPIYNQGGTTAFTKNLFGFVESDGTEHYATTTQYAVGSWTWEVIDLTLAKETTGYLSLGYTSASNGNADMPHLFVDRVVICDASANMAVNATAKWGTFCASFAVAIPGGVTAYTCESATDGKLDLVEVTTGAIPANTPVILNAEDGLASTTFYGKKVANATDDLIEGGWLRGNVSTSAMDIDYTGNEYLLQRNNNKTGFYKMDNTHTYKVGYNRCYLVMPIGVQARDAYYMDGDDFTGINSVEAAEAEGGTLKDGKYLIEGKIVLVKNGVKYGANGQKLN